MRKGYAPVKGQKATFGDFDPVPSILDTWRAMEQVARRGLTQSIGVSNFGVRRLRQVKSSQEHSL